MYKFLSGLLVVAALTPFISYAALTDAQIQSVTSLVRAFGADDATVTQVSQTLGGSVLGVTAACPSLTTTLRRGSRDSVQVRTLQKFLAQYYSLSETDLVTGYFGPRTEQLVITFQKEHGLDPVGIVGVLTRAKIASLCTGGTVGTTPIIKPGPVCPAIAYIPAPCSGTLTPRYDTNGCQNGWICNQATSTLPTVTVTTDPSSPAFALAAANSSVPLVAMRLSATGEAVSLNTITVSLAEGMSQDLESITLFKDGAPKGTAFFVGAGTQAVFTLAAPIVIPKGEYVVFTVHGKLSPIGTGQAVTESGHKVRVEFKSLTGAGTTSLQSTAVQGGTQSAGVRVTKSFPTVLLDSSSLPIGGVADGRLFRFKISADARGPVGIGQIAFNLANNFSITDIGLYAYEDPNYSTPVSGQAASGLLGTIASPANPLRYNLVSPLQIPAGSSRYFELRGTVPTVITGSSVTTTLLGNNSAQGVGPFSSLFVDGANLIWSPNSVMTSTLTTNDWVGGYGVPGLPSTGLSYTRSSGITPPPSSITVTAPNGGEQWELGTMNTITWSPYGYNPDINPSRDVKAYLERKDGTSYVPVGTILPSGKASIHWETDINSYGTRPAPGSYYVRIVNTVTGQSDRSDAPFTLYAKSVDLKLNGSDGPVSVDLTRPVTLSWTTTNVARCELHNAYPDATRQRQVGAVPLAGTMDVYISSSGPTLYCYRSDGSARYDSVLVSTQSSPAMVQVLSPNGGEQVVVGNPHTIAWQAQNALNPSIALYRNDQWVKWIVKSLPGAQTSYAWTPTLDEAEAVAPWLGSVYKIYVTAEKSDGTGYVDDKSDGTFTFVSAPVKPPACPLVVYTPIVCNGTVVPTYDVNGCLTGLSCSTTTGGGESVRQVGGTGTQTQ